MSMSVRVHLLQTQPEAWQPCSGLHVRKASLLSWAMITSDRYSSVSTTITKVSSTFYLEQRTILIVFLSALLGVRLCKTLAHALTDEEHRFGKGGGDWFARYA